MPKNKAGNGFSHDVTGNTFMVNGVKFEVTAVAPFPEAEISPTWKRGLMAVDEDSFVCARFGAYLVPTIRCPGGVVKLTSVIIGGRTLTKANEIAVTLGATEAYKAYKLKRKD